jgi:glutamate dehydrogenase (NAD(P)+)
MSESVFRFCDDLGPARIVHIYRPVTGLKAIVVVDNAAAGPAIGGVRMAPDVSLEECVRLARAMTFKNAAAGLPHGGGKAVLFGDPATDPERKEELVRAFACAVGPIVDYIVGPDMGTDETAMAWVKDEIGRAVGLPPELGGIPLDEIGATGFGLLAAADVAKDYAKLELDGATVAVQGFGAVGKHAARFFAERGTVLVAAADSSGTVHDPAGLNVAKLVAVKNEGGHLVDAGIGRVLDRDAIVGIECDIWIPAARPDVINADNVDELKTKLVVQGANIGVTEEAEARLYERGVVSIPDFISNAGGVICAAVEYEGGSQTEAFAIIDEKIRANTAEVFEHSQHEGISPRSAAIAMTESRIRTAMSLRRWS